MRKLLQRYRDQQSNKGSSLVMVVSIVAIIGILAFSLLTISLITYKMKATNMNSKRNFYDAEKVMDDISLGLQEDISKAAGDAYAWTLENFSANNATEEVRRSNYVNKFYDVLLQRILDDTVVNTYALHYKVDHLKGMVSDDAKADAKSVLVKAYGDLNIINQDIDSGTYTIKNLFVKYTDKKNYTTEIRTDVVLSCPQLDFDQMNTVPLDLTTFALVANNKTETSGNNIKIKGSSYLGNQGVEIFPANDISFENPTGNNTCRIITAGNVKVKQKGSFSVGDVYQLWARSLVLDGADANVAGQTYLNNDIVLDTLKTGSNQYISSKLTMSGNLFAYGNPKTAGAAEIYRQVYQKNGTVDGTERFQKSYEPYYSDGNLSSGDQSLMDVNEADFSSAVLINGRNATIDFSGLDEMVIAGNAYVGASLKGSGNTDIKMGETLSLKSDQRAYLVPPEYIAPFSKFGGKNPMLSSNYSKLNDDIKTKMGYAHESDIALWDYLRTDTNAVASIPEDLAKDGVVDIRRVVYRLSYNTSASVNNMVYFFLVFNNEESANEFAKNHWMEARNLSSLKGHLYPDFDGENYLDAAGNDNSSVKITYPTGLDLDNPGEFNTYFNGCVLLPKGKDTKFYPGMLARSNKYPNLDADEANYQQTYAALRHKLTVDATGMSSVEGARELYDNLVVPDMNALTSPKVGIPLGDKRVYTQDGDPSSKMCAVVVNGDYTVPASAEESGFPIHVIIANGNVTVPENCNYTGLLVAHGKVTLGAGALLTANTELAQQALSIVDSTSQTCASDFLLNGSMFSGSSVSSSTDEEDEVNFADYVTYSNWTKQ